MKKAFILITFLCLSVVAKAAFIEGLEDVPIMSGMKQIQSDNLSFGNEESRLVETVLTGETIKFSDVVKFYKTTLPQMGWIYQKQKESYLMFEREGEIIEISKEQTKPLMVRITVKSKL